MFWLHFFVCCYDVQIIIQQTVVSHRGQLLVHFRFAWLKKVLLYFFLIQVKVFLLLNDEDEPIFLWAKGDEYDNSHSKEKKKKRESTKIPQPSSRSLPHPHQTKR